ncbi:acylneuraminate cytidylyltransferase [Jeotgalibacillus malaysiensis]|uniref:Acylneuraminate cytidylyltransferase n=1 Tax=Jeotgalibacillus malaysiensis TaxID=1508404 RepID=A0A0B5APV8_9BACL|nr:glycosyltransferase family protein [Jeotgalibacillus malaysiensis]AJD92136.1 acylneuraminate cytidylyltransferase [Jeotgalibacillus malaysiensis]
MKTAVIIQARMGSTRLSGKVMKELKGASVLSHVITRVRQAALVDEVIIATTTLDRDDVIEEEAKKNNALVFRGSEHDVLSRYYLAAKEYQIDIIVRVTSDCPVIDPHVIDDLVSQFEKGSNEVVTNAGPDASQRTFPRGLDTEVFSFQMLEEAFLNAKETYQREHVTPYIYEHSDHIHYVQAGKDESRHRWTLDTEEDLALMVEIYDRLFQGTHDFYLRELLQLFEQEPSLAQINAHIEQKKVK